jgi:hypothetical protein
MFRTVPEGRAYEAQFEQKEKIGKKKTILNGISSDHANDPPPTHMPMWLSLGKNEFPRFLGDVIEWGLLD